MNPGPKTGTGPRGGAAKRRGSKRSDERPPRSQPRTGKEEKEGSPETEPGTGEWDEDLVEVTDTATIDGAVRDLDPPEREAVAELLAPFGDDIMIRLEARYVLKVIGRQDIEPHRRVFAMRRPTLAQLASYDPIFLGIPVAHLARKGGRLTLEGGRLIAPFASRRVVLVNEKATQLFLYGRHLFAQSLIGVTGKPDKGDEVLVVDEADRFYLGLGIADVALRPLVRGSGRSGAQTAIVIHNRADLGLYLRAQQAIPE